MDLRRARTFVTVAELGTVSKAALRLRTAQPALSRQISAFEQELGLKLFDRIGRGLVLTSDGEQMLGDCRALLGHASALGERAQVLRGGDVGVLKVASSPQFIEGVLADFLHGYAKRFPRVQVKLIEAMGWSSVRDLLERGEIHLGQGLAQAVPADEGRFAGQAIEPVDLLVACQPGLKLAKGSTIEVSDLASHPLLLLDRQFVFRRTFDSACRLAGVEPNIRLESQTPHTLLAMAEAGHGVAIVPSTLRAKRYALRVYGLSYQGRRLREPLAIYWDNRRPLPRYASAFCEMLAAYAREVFPITRPSALRPADKPRPRGKTALRKPVAAE
jgi:DNA-binding transcriptional LysR family regulator